MATGIIHVERVASFRRTNATIAQVTYAFEALLRLYEATGDHDHGSGPIRDGKLADGRPAVVYGHGDCAACNARRVVLLLGHSL